MPERLSETEKENFSKIFSLKLAKSLENKFIDFENAAKLIQAFLSRLENAKDAREIEDYIGNLTKTSSI